MEWGLEFGKFSKVTTKLYNRISKTNQTRIIALFSHRKNIYDTKGVTGPLSNIGTF